MRPFVAFLAKGLGEPILYPQRMGSPRNIFLNEAQLFQLVRAVAQVELFQGLAGGNAGFLVPAHGLVPHIQALFQVFPIQLHGALLEGLEVRLLIEDPVGDPVVILAQVGAAQIQLETHGGHDAEQLADALGIPFLIVPCVGFAQHGGHVLGIQVEVADVIALLAGGDGHGVHPVAEGGAVVPLLADEGPLGKFDLVLVDGGVVLLGVGAAFAEEVLQHGLDDLVVGRAGGAEVDQVVDHAVTVVP